MVITIDGLSGNGKTTLADMIANHLGFKRVSAGDFFRCITYEMLTKGLDIDNNRDQTIEYLNTLDISYDDNNNVLLNGINVTDAIRTKEVSINSSKVANNKDVQNIVTLLQRHYLDKNNVVLDGRDVGTRVAPDADYKFYIYADKETRVKRLMAEKPDVDRVEIEKELDARDLYDLRGNFVRPMGAFEIETSNKTLEQVFGEMIEKIDPNKPRTIIEAND
jgi:cytidylate kinase